MAAISDANPAANSIVENSPTGTVVGVTINAIDADATDTISYSLDDDAGGRFAVDAITGVVTTAAVLDTEAFSEHTITARATSTDGSFSVDGFTIEVLDVNESIGLAPDVDPSPNTVAEDAPIGTTVGVTILASDPDAGDTVTYSLDDDAGERRQGHRKRRQEETSGTQHLLLDSVG